MSKWGPQRARCSRLLSAAALALALAAAGAPAADASHGQEAIFQDGNGLLADPGPTLARLRLLGVQRLRLFLIWSQVAPDAGSRVRPAGFDAADPAAYPPGAWTTWDQVIEAATANGIGVDLDVSGGAPLWATGPGAPKYSAQTNWEPSASEFGQFVRAVGTRYSGSYQPAGASAPLPRVNFFSIWNEPDYGPSLAPQGVPGHLLIENSPRMYRNLVDAGWSALHATGHGGDTFLFGELAPRGRIWDWGLFSGMKPLRFLRVMYCVDANYRPLRGLAAAQRGCPTTAAGSRRFRKAHPALFEASGVSDHPYMRWYPPNREQYPDPDYSTLALLPQFEHALDRLQRVYGSHTRFPIYNTEFGYLTGPPKHPTKKLPWVSPATATYYMNWAEYMSWRDPRVASTEQYLLSDPVQPVSANEFGGFASGLLNFDGSQKPTYGAYRMPLYLPHTHARRGHSLYVWGCVRPAPDASFDTGQPQTVQIQFQRGGRGPFLTLQTLTISDPRGYLQTHIVFPASGMVRLAWGYPSLDPALGDFDAGESHTVLSRAVRVVVR